MEEKELKKEIIINNSQYKERFQFLLSVNDNIICQRYFKVNGFNEHSLESYELKETIDEIVDEIKNDLVSKSRVLLWYTSKSPVKLRGFIDGEKEEFLEYTEDTPPTVYDDNERLVPYEVTFKFSFIVDNHVLYERIWDGTDYPKFVRNSVDITNSDARYRDKDVSLMPFNIAILRHLTVDREDLVYKSINKLCAVLSNTFVNKYGYYTEAIDYAGKKYYCSLHNKKYVYGHRENNTEENYGDEQYYETLYEKKFIDGWENSTKDKTKQYFASLYPSVKQCEKIDKYM